MILRQDFGAYQHPTPQMWWGWPPPHGRLRCAAWGREQSVHPPQDMKGLGTQILGKKPMQGRDESCCRAAAHVELTHRVLCPQPFFESEFSEILLCKNELHETLNNLSHWMKDEHVDKSLVRGKMR